MPPRTPRPPRGGGGTRTERPAASPREAPGRCLEQGRPARARGPRRANLSRRQAGSPARLWLGHRLPPGSSKNRSGGSASRPRPSWESTSRGTEQPASSANRPGRAAAPDRRGHGPRAQRILELVFLQLRERPLWSTGETTIPNMPGDEPRPLYALRAGPPLRAERDFPQTPPASGDEAMPESPRRPDSPGSCDSAFPPDAGGATCRGRSWISRRPASAEEPLAAGVGWPCSPRLRRWAGSARPAPPRRPALPRHLAPPLLSAPPFLVTPPRPSCRPAPSSSLRPLLVAPPRPAPPLGHAQFGGAERAGAACAR